MEIVTIGHEAKNAVMQIMQLFFSLSADIRVESLVREERGSFVAEAVIEFNNQCVSATASTQSDEKLYRTNTVKKSVFYAAKKLSDMPSPWGISTGIRPAKTARKMLDDNLSEEKILDLLKNEYLMEDKKASLAVSVAKKEREILKSMPQNSVSIYVGIPFCPSRCSYCSFISQATEHNKKFIVPYVKALLKEIEYTGKIIKNLGMKPDTVYFGGGTPTAIDESLLKEIIGKVKSEFDMSSLREFTVEAGRPDTFSLSMMEMLKKENVGRISINPQSMHQKTLDAIGRRHTVRDVENAFEMAKSAGIGSINADLIAGLPGEDKSMMEETVERILSLEPQSVTVHTLYMKRASQMIDDFEKLRFALHASEMMDVSVKKLGEKGIEPYYMYKQRNTLGNLENVGFGKKGHESLYNVYIMEEVQPIVALGAGGSTKMVRGDVIDRVFNPKEAADYTERLDEVLKRKDTFYDFYKK